MLTISGLKEQKDKMEDAQKIAINGKNEEIDKL